MIEIDAVLRDMAPYAPGAPEPVMLHHARTAAIEFLRRVQIWRDSDTFDIEPGDHGIICAPDYAQVHRFTSVTFNGQPLEPVSYAAFNELVRPQSSDPSEPYIESIPRWYTQAAPNTIKVGPEGRGTLTVKTVLIPTEEADVLPSFVMEQYRRDIAAGGLATLLMLPGQPFTNPELANINAARFNQRMTELFSLSLKGQQRAPVRTRARYL